jgi:hypothetical protein
LHHLTWSERQPASYLQAGKGRGRVTFFTDIMKEHTGKELDKRASDYLKILNNRVLPDLCRRFYSKGLVPVEIERITKDILNIIGDGGLYSAAILNRKLERLGWGKDIVDNHIFDLIVYYLQWEGIYEVEAYIPLDKILSTGRYFVLYQCCIAFGQLTKFQNVSLDYYLENYTTDQFYHQRINHTTEIK